MQFFKYHALGNDYIVLDPRTATWPMTEQAIRIVCHRNLGIGSDGILLGPLPAGGQEYQELASRAGAAGKRQTLCGLRIFNPDGSEAEKSGNGLRIFCRYLYDQGIVKEQSFQLLTLGGLVQCQVMNDGHAVRVEMGKVSFNSGDIPVQGPLREVVQEEIEVAGCTFAYCAATIGNPHCIIVRERVDADETRLFGPYLENDPRFPNRTNVQFMRILDRHHIQIEIWERGAGYTLASGSSASACAATACRLGECDSPVTVHMPGGELQIQVATDFSIVMHGPVRAVAVGTIAADLCEEMGLLS